MTVEEIAIQPGIATAGGLALGPDREVRGIAAGVQTHALVALGSALITVSALMRRVDLQKGSNSSVDPLRVVQGLAQAIGFVAAGAIFFARGEIHNLTSAASLWLAAAVGITAGAGRFTLVVVGLGFGILILTVVRVIEAMALRSLKTLRLDDGQRADDDRAT